MTKGSFQFQLNGFPAANRDAEITLKNRATGQEIKRNPFLDGSMTVRDIDAGTWDVKVTHPNLIATPIFQGPIRVFPQPAPTFVPIPVKPDLFKDTPIRDIPDANLGPVQQSLTAIRDAVGPISAKAPGEVIRASDWNILSGAVRDLADNTLQLTSLVSPQGHDHPEIAEKIAEVQDNIRNVMESFGKSLLELRREIETEFVRRTVDKVLTTANASTEIRTELLGRVNTLATKYKAEPTAFTGELALAGNRFLTVTNEFIAANPALASNDDVKTLQSISQVYATSGVQTKADNELKIYGMSSAAGMGKLMGLTR